MIGIHFSGLAPTATPKTAVQKQQPVQFGLTKDTVQFGKADTKTELPEALKGAKKLDQKIGPLPVYVKGNNLAEDSEMEFIASEANGYVDRFKDLDDKGFWVQVSRDQGEEEFLIMILKKDHKDPLLAGFADEDDFADITSSLIDDLLEHDAYKKA